MNYGEFCRFSDLFKKRGDLRGDPTLQNAVWVVIFAEPKWLTVNNCKHLHFEIYNNEDMTKSPSPKKLPPFHIRNKDMEKETATLFIRIHTRKIDVLVSTMLQVEVAD